MDTLKILIIDNYDSFTYNLFQLIGSFENTQVDVFRNDEIGLDEIISRNYQAIVLSPGPGNPENVRDFGICKEVIQNLMGVIPILGVCLGHQGMGYILKGKVIRAKRILHGKTSRITHLSNGLFQGIPNGIQVARYHSLILDKNHLPENVVITAETDEEEIMAIQHKEYPLFGVQFHPESFMTQYGTKMIANFLEIAKSKQKMTIKV